MSRPVDISHFISLVVYESLDEDLVKRWFKIVKDNSPSGIMMTTQVIDEKGRSQPVALIERNKDKNFTYTIPLSRYIDCDETQTIVDAFYAYLVNNGIDLDFDIEISTNPLVDDFVNNEAISIEDEKYLQLCNAWAKRQHDSWMAERLSGGWKYGITMNLTDKTHPLLMPWEQLPDRFKKIDLDEPQALVDLLNSQGYTIVRKEEIDAILKLLRIK